jgi:hypothetical protein
MIPGKTYTIKAYVDDFATADIQTWIKMCMPDYAENSAVFDACQFDKLERAEIRTLIEIGLCNVLEALKLEFNEVCNVQSQAIQLLIRGGTITFDMAKKLSIMQRFNLESPAIQSLLQQNILSYTVVLNLSMVQRVKLENPDILHLIRQLKNTIEPFTVNDVEMRLGRLGIDKVHEHEIFNNFIHAFTLLDEPSALKKKSTFSWRSHSFLDYRRNISNTLTEPLLKMTNS